MNAKVKDTRIDNASIDNYPILNPMKPVRRAQFLDLLVSPVIIDGKVPTGLTPFHQAVYPGDLATCSLFIATIRKPKAYGPEEGDLKLAEMSMQESNNGFLPQATNNREGVNELVAQYQQLYRKLVAEGKIGSKNTTNNIDDIAEKVQEVLMSAKTVDVFALNKIEQATTNKDVDATVQQVAEESEQVTTIQEVDATVQQAPAALTKFFVRKQQSKASKKSNELTNVQEAVTAEADVNTISTLRSGT